MPDSDVYSGVEKIGPGMEKIKLPELIIDPHSSGIPVDQPIFDFMGTLEEMKESVQSGGNGDDAGLNLDEGLGADFIGGLVSDKFVDRTQQLLDEANQLIREKRFAKAIEVLDGLLAHAPDNHQALYLKAMCLASKQEMENEAALKILLPLSRARLEGSLNTKVKMLRDRVKRTVLLRVMIEHLLMLRTNMRSKVVSRLQSIIPLIPEEPIYPFMLSGTLMMDNRLDEALEVIDRALTAVSKDQADRLRQLRAEIGKRQVAVALKGVVVNIRAERYAEARKTLNALDKALRKNTLWKIFDNYLKDIGCGGILGRMFGGTKPSKAAVPRGGSDEEIDQFYLMICAVDVQNAQKHIAQKNYAQAVSVLLPVLEKWAPVFPYANYLCSVAIYFQLKQAFISGEVPDLDSAIADLEKGQRMALIGSQDLRIEDVKNLSAALEGSLKTLYEVRKMRAGMEKEVQPIKKVMGEYNRIMEGAKGGISSKKQHKKVLKQMIRVVDEIATVRRRSKHLGNKKVLDELYEAATKNLQQLKNMAGEMKHASEGKLVKKHWDAFGALAKVLNNPSSIRSYKDIKNLRTKVSNLKDKAVKDRQKMRSAQAREAMDKLIGQLVEVLSMFNR